MTKLIHVIRQILSGTRAIDERKKYQVVAAAIGLVHLCFAFLFLRIHILPLVIYNGFVVVYYVTMAVIMGRVKRYTYIFISVFIEILFHSILVSILLGWGWGFMVYTLGLVPITFYIGYTIPYLNQKIMIPAVASLVVVICYYAVRIITYRIEPLITTEYPVSIVNFTYYFNIFLTFVFLWFTSILFALEIRYMQNSLEFENHSLERMANIDPLTHLYNRRSMNEYLKKVMEIAKTEEQTFCLIMADIDDFKKVNDTYGHAAGDAVLVEVAQLISASVREEDYVCRWGGEEILVLIRADKQTSIQVAERICHDVAGMVIHNDGIDLSVTLTIGVSEFHADETIRTLVGKADERMYHGKRSGKNQVVAI